MFRRSISRRQLLRTLLLGLSGVAVVGSVTACGRKGQLSHPEGVEYPKVYPSPKKKQ